MLFPKHIIVVQKGSDMGVGEPEDIHMSWLQPMQSACTPAATHSSDVATAGEACMRGVCSTVVWRARTCWVVVEGRGVESIMASVKSHTPRACSYAHKPADTAWIGRLRTTGCRFRVLSRHPCQARPFILHGGDVLLQLVEIRARCSCGRRFGERSRYRS